ncbi:MAG TPA: LytR C-terminal domain-containing protein [Acidimicrobiia bacterium]
MRGAVLIGLAVIVGVVGLQILDDNNTGVSDVTGLTSVTGITGSTGSTGSTSPTRSTVPGSSATTTTLKIRPTSQVRVKVYNASGIQGNAQKITNMLKANGYATQAPANNSTTRTTSVVQCRAGFENDARLLALFQIAHGATVEAFPANPPAGSGDADCLVILGTNS